MTEINDKAGFEQALETKNKWSSHSDRTNTNNNASFLTQWVVPASQVALHHQWVFSHTPKTAGTSFDRFLAQFFELKDILHVNAPDLNPLPQVVHLKKNFPQLISGHHPFHGLLYQLLPQKNLVHLGLMRRPVDRIISYYNYISTRDYHALNKRVKDMSFSEFLDLQDLPELQNGQSRRFAGTLHSTEPLSENELYHLAKEHIEQCFTLVGVTEQLQDFCDFLSQKVKVKRLEIPRINSSRLRVQLADLTSEHKERIEAKNRVDIQLYEFVKSRFNQIISC